MTRQTEREPFAVKQCNGCEHERLTMQTTDGRDLCSKCMREVPRGKRPEIAKNLGQADDNGMHHLSVQIPASMFAALQEEALDQGISVSEHVRRVLKGR